MNSKQSTQTSEAKTRRDEVAAFIEDYSIAHGGNSPTLHEIGQALYISKTTVHMHLTRLIVEGRAVRRDGKVWLTSHDKR